MSSVALHKQVAKKNLDVKFENDQIVELNGSSLTN